MTATGQVMTQYRLLRLPVTSIAVMISALLSLWSIALHPLLNDDAYGYLRAAELFNAEGAGAVLDQYGWYGYSILIALLDRVLPGDLLVSAQVLNSACQTLLVYTFITLVRECQGSVRTQWFAALVILAHPLLNDMRYFLIRDFGFWAFGLLSLLHLVRYVQHQRWQSALYWCLALCAAITFRLEGFLLAAFAPLALLGTAGVRQRWRALSLFYGLLLGMVILLFLLVLLVLQVNLLGLFQFAYRYYLPLLFDLLDVLRSGVISANQAMFTQTNFPGHDNIFHGSVILLFAYVYTVLANVVNAFTLPLAVLLACAAWRRWLQVPAALRLPLYVYAACSLLGLLVFLSIMHFQTERYATFLCLLLLLLVPFVLDRLYVLAQERQTVQRFKLVLGFFCVYYFTDSLVSFGYSTRYITDAAMWTADNLSDGDSLHTNEFAIAFGSGLVEDYDKVPTDIAVLLQEVAPSHYLALSLKARDQSWREHVDNMPQLQLLERFANKRGDEVRIYVHRLDTSE